jgi:hypothetical protein
VPATAFSRNAERVAADPTLTITPKGQVTLKRDLLKHLGVGPGDKVVVELLPSGNLSVRAAPRGPLEDIFGIIPSGGVSVSIDEMNQTIADGWAGKR